MIVGIELNAKAPEFFAPGLFARTVTEFDFSKTHPVVFRWIHRDNPVQKSYLEQP